MVGGMAGSRALAEVGFDFGIVTHLSGNSGGQWFATQFLYNQDFKNALVEKQCTTGIWWWKTSSYCPINTVLSEWGKGFSQRVAAANLAPAAPLSCKVNILGLDVDIKPFLSLFQGGLSVLSLPASDWLAYVTALLDIPDIGTLTYTDAPRTLDVTLTQMLGVPQSAFLGDRASDGSLTLATPCSDAGKAVTRGAYMTRQSAASVASVPGITGLRFSDGTTSLSTLSGTACGATAGDTNLSFPTPDSLHVKDVAAISSAAAGGVGSYQYAQAFTRVLALNGVLAEFTTEIADEVAACFPLGLGPLAPLFPTTPASSFRGVDGGYVDNSAVIASLAAVMRQCAAGDASIDCSEKRFSVVFVDGDMMGYTCLFTGGCPTDKGTREQYGVPVFDTTIFADTFPTDWSKYVPWWGVASADSQFHFGTFTTVANAAYGIEAGWRVSILSFVIVAEEIVYPIIAPADSAELTFGTLYSIVANEQIEGMKTVMGNWMAVDSELGASSLTMEFLSAGLDTEAPSPNATSTNKKTGAIVGGVVGGVVGIALVLAAIFLPRPR